MRINMLYMAAVLVAFGLVWMSPGAASAQEKPGPVVVLKTSLGDITIELYPDKAPETVENFLWYVDNKFYEGLIFHRVIANFMIQGGGFNKNMVKKEPRNPIKNEADNGLSNLKGTIAMARTNEPHSASSQFFINVKDNEALDFKNKTTGWGYCVFGRVIDGMDVVEKIRQVPTTSKDGYADVPVTPVMINKVYKLAADEVKALKAKEKEKP